MDLPSKKALLLLIGNGIYNYHTDALISEVIKDLSEKKNISAEFATNYINMAGLKIYSTQNTYIQEEIEKEFNKKQYIIPPKQNDDNTSQAAMIVLDNKNGFVLRMLSEVLEKKLYQEVSIEQLKQ